MKQKFVYIGARISNKNTNMYSYLQLNDDGSHGDNILNFKKKLNQFCQIGSILEFEMVGDSAKGPYNVVGKIEDAEYIKTWSAKELASKKHKEMVDAAKKLPDDHIVKYIRDLKRKVTRTEARHLALWIFNELNN